jgi:hypothetical protein
MVVTFRAIEPLLFYAFPRNSDMGPPLPRTDPNSPSTQKSQRPQETRKRRKNPAFHRARLGTPYNSMRVARIGVCAPFAPLASFALNGSAAPQAPMALAKNIKL